MKEKQKTHRACKSPSLLRDDKANSNTDLKVRSSSQAKSNGSKGGFVKASNATDTVYPKTECLPGRKFSTVLPTHKTGYHGMSSQT